MYDAPYPQQMTALSRKDYLPIIERALQEDHTTKDITTLSIFKAGKVDNSSSKALLICKQKGILAGTQLAKDVFLHIDPNLKVSILVQEGEPLQAQQNVLEIQGSTIAILKAERVALNLLSFTSGIATKTYECQQVLLPSNIKVVDTRKTIPSLRVLCKYAVSVGGGINHRFNLETMGLIKDNHIKATSGVKNAIRTFYSTNNLQIPLEVEIDTFKQLQEALEFGKSIHCIMLDNMSIETINKCCQFIHQFNKKHNQRIYIEASGGYSLENIAPLKNTTIDYVSMGSLTNTINPIDFSLEI